MWNDRENRYHLTSKSNGSFGHFQGWSADGVTTHDEDEVNARLISSAPEMLAALQYLLNPENVAITHAKWGEGCNREEVNAMMKQARSAIAKATGQACP